MALRCKGNNADSRKDFSQKIRIHANQEQTDGSIPNFRNLATELFFVGQIPKDAGPPACHFPVFSCDFFPDALDTHIIETEGQIERPIKQEAEWVFGKAIRERR